MGSTLVTSEKPKASNKKRILPWAFLCLGLSAIFLGKPLLHLARHWPGGSETFKDLLPEGFVDDASRLGRTEVREVWKMPANAGDPERQLAGLLSKARVESLRVSIAGARHSMGGHTIYPGGIVVDMRPYNRMRLDQGKDLLWVQAGALWGEVIEYLDPLGKSVGVMQSNDSFTVGGSVSVNCHGWQFGKPPIASTVHSFRLMKADGKVVKCSRSENAELFSLALGGYGLFGVILDLELRVVENRTYRLEQRVVPAGEALGTFDGKILGKPGLDMVYARMNVASDKFLDEVILNAFFIAKDATVPGLAEPGLVQLRRAIFRGSVESDYGKELRWETETKLQPLLRGGKVFSRNQLLNEGVEVFQNRTSGTTDILHEYFVPRSRVGGFVAAMQGLIPGSGVDLLNVTVRAVEEDADTFLRYADQPMIAFVMLFVQQRTKDGEKRMQALTRKLVDAAFRNEGRYYLPYRLHATQAQFEQAYPQATEFFQAKLRYDPGQLFQNRFYLQYGSPKNPVSTGQ